MANSLRSKWAPKAFSNGDQIIIILSEHKKEVVEIFNINPKPVELEHLSCETEHIENMIRLFIDSMKEIQI